MVNGKRVVDIQIPGGTIESISLVGAEGTEIPATVENGHAEIRLEEIEVDELAVNKLYIHDKDIEDMIPDLSGARNLQDAETVDLEEGFDMDELA